MYFKKLLIVLSLWMGYSINSLSQDKSSATIPLSNITIPHDTLWIDPAQISDLKTVTCENIQNPQYHALLLQAINDIRSKSQQCGRTTFPTSHALTWNNQLYTSAFAHANDLAQRQTLSHLGKNGETLKIRIKLTGYSGGGGENLASGQNTLFDVLNDWMKLSPAHCMNLVQEKFNHYAIACVRNKATHRPYWVQHFGSGKK